MWGSWNVYQGRELLSVFELVICMGLAGWLGLQKRLEELPEAELETMLAQVEEEKIRLQQRRQNKNSS